MEYLGVGIPAMLMTLADTFGMVHTSRHHPTDTNLKSGTSKWIGSE